MTLASSQWCQVVRMKQRMPTLLHHKLLNGLLHAQGDDAHRTRLPRPMDTLGNLLMLCVVKLQLEDEASVCPGQREPCRERARLKQQCKWPSLGSVEGVEARLQGTGCRIQGAG